MGGGYQQSQSSSHHIQYVFASDSHAKRKNAHVTKGVDLFLPIWEVFVMSSTAAILSFMQARMS